MTTTKQQAADAQRAYQRGECDLATMQAAQRAYDLERTAPQREAEAQRQREEWTRQEAIWASIGERDEPRIRQMARDLDCVRTARGITRLVPPTSHWANWRDDDAILHHGQTASALVDRFSALSQEPWDGTYAHLWFFAGIND